MSCSCSGALTASSYPGQQYLPTAYPGTAYAQPYASPYIGASSPALGQQLQSLVGQIGTLVQALQGLLAPMSANTGLPSAFAGYQQSPQGTGVVYPTDTYHPGTPSRPYSEPSLPSYDPTQDPAYPPYYPGGRDSADPAPPPVPERTSAPTPPPNREPGQAPAPAPAPTPPPPPQGPGQEPVQQGKDWRWIKEMGETRFGLRNDEGDSQTTGGEHGANSEHYRGRAVDFGDAKNSREQLNAWAQWAREQGLDVLDEGNHIHVSLPGQGI